MKKPKISVLIPTYNRRNFLKEALLSVVWQSVKPYEVIVADDNTDPVENEKNEEVVREFSKKYDFVIYHKNKVNFGPAGNYKNLFYLASGDLIQFLGDDDILSPVALEKLSKPLIENNDITVSGGRTFFANNNLNIYSRGNFYGYNMIVASKIFKDYVFDGRNVIKHSYLNGLKNVFGSFSGFMFRKKDVDFELFNFNGTEIVINSDIFLWMSLLRKGGKAFLSKDFLNIFRLHGKNDQFNIGDKSLKEVLLFHQKDFIDYLGIGYDSINQEYLHRTIYAYLTYPDAKYSSLQNKTSPYLRYFIESPNLEKETNIIEDILLILNGREENLIKRVTDFTGEYIAFIDQDTVPANQIWKEVLVKKFQEDKSITTISAISNTGLFDDNILVYLSKDLLGYLSLQEIANLISNTYRDSVYPSPMVSQTCWITRKNTFLDFCKTFDSNFSYKDLWFYYSIFLKEKNYKHVIMPSLVFYTSNTQKTGLENSEDVLKTLIKTYGYGNVPEPYEYFYGEKKQLDYPFLPAMKSGRYRFVFNFSGKTKGKNFFREKAAIIKSSPKICIITVNYKTYDEVKTLAKSVVENRYKNMDFVVVDNSENENMFNELVKDLEKIFSNSEKKFYAIKNQNTGYAGGNNLGITFCLENIKPRYVWILNPDTVIGSNTPVELIKTLEYTDVPVVTCKMIDSLSGLCQYNGKNASYAGGLSDSCGIFRARFLSGANIFMKAEAIERIGLFEEKFFLYFEDNEYKQRMEKAGIFPLYTPFSYILHKGAASTEGYLKSPLSVYYYVRNFLHFNSENLDNETKLMVVEPILRNEIRKIYTQNIRKRDILVSIVLGIHDYFKGIYGKVDLEERFNNVLDSIIDDQTLEWDLNKVLDKTFSYILKKPRDVDAFDRIIDLIYGLNLSKTLT